jgi:predicted transcriptional regulator
LASTVEVRRAIEERLGEIDRELRDVRALEHEREVLQRALSELDDESAGEARSSRARSGSGRRTQGRGARRAPRGSNQQAILDHIREHPGATARTLADATGIQRSVVYSAVSRLTAAGQLVREQLPDGQVAYRLGGSGDEALSEG